jgi:hypothetical protein
MENYNEILDNLIQLINEQENIDNEIVELVNEHFWELA